MCPICLSTIGLVVAGGAAASGCLTTLVVRRFVRAAAARARPRP